MKYALIKSPIGSLRKETKELSTLEDETIYGMKVEILERINEEWFRVKTHYRYEGLMNSNDLLFEAELLKHWDCANKAVVCHSFADVLTLPKVQGARIIALPKGALVELVGTVDDSGWIEIGLVDGQHGFIKDAFLTSAKPSMYVDEFVAFEPGCSQKERILKYLHNKLHMTEEEFRNNLVETALSYRRVQYRWGGKTSLGIDCSGLCSVAYMLNGVIIYRDAKIVPGFPLHEIAFEEKKPGDLLFFPGHVAMYIGDGRYVHSTNKKGSDGVVINSVIPEHPDYREDLLKSLVATGSIF